MTSEEFVLVVPSEYDYRFSTPLRRTFLVGLATQYRQLLGRDLLWYFVGNA